MRRTVIRRALGFVLFQVAFHCIFSNPNQVAAQGIVAWGANEYGQRDIPPDLTNAVALAGGELHSLALLRDGRLVGWGAGTNTTGAYPQYGQPHATNMPLRRSARLCSPWAAMAITLARPAGGLA